MLFKGDDGITRRLGSGQRSNVYGKDPVRSVLDLTKCLRERADLEAGTEEIIGEELGAVGTQGIRFSCSTLAGADM